MTVQYTSEDIATLPSDNSELSHVLDAGELNDVAILDGVYASVNNTLGNAIFQFEKDATGLFSDTITWVGKADIAPSDSTVYLQIYKVAAPAGWETIDSDNATAAATDFTLTATVADLTNYKDGSGIIYCRVYQATSGAFVGPVEIATGVMQNLGAGLFSSAHKIIRMADGTIVVCFLNTSTNKLQLYKSTNGSIWTEFSGSAPDGYYDCALATDGTNWFVLWYSSTTELSWNTGTTYAYPAAQVVLTPSPSYPNLDIALDSSGYSHIVYGRGNGFEDYSNNIGAGNPLTGTFKAGVALTAIGNDCSTSIAIDTTNSAGHRFDLPQIAFCDSANERLDVGTANNAAAFTEVTNGHSVFTTGMGISLCIDSAGQTNNSYIWFTSDREFSVLRIPGATDWSPIGNWTDQQVAVTANSTPRYSLLAIDGTDRYLFILDAGVPSLVYYKSAAYGAWSGPTTLDTTAGMVHLSVRWQYANNPAYSTYGIDYIFDDGTKVYYNRLAI